MAQPQRTLSASTNRSIWYWNERDNELATRADPFKKSHTVKACFTKYFPGVSNVLKARLRNQRNHHPNSTEKETAMGIFKRTAEAAGTVVSWGKGVVNDNTRARNWTLDSVLELALDEFKSELQNPEKNIEFNNLINRKAIKTKNVMCFYKLLDRYRKTD